MKKSFNFLTLLPVFLIISGILLLIFRVLIARRSTLNNQPTEQNTDEPDDIQPEDLKEELSPDQTVVNHYQLIRKVLPPELSDDFVKMVTAQAMHETGNFKSRLYREQNNMFGMRHPTIRDTKSIGMLNDYANFADLDDSVRDLVLYWKEFNYPLKYKDVAAYVKQLKSHGYFTAGYVPYFNAVRSHYNRVVSLIQ